MKTMTMMIAVLAVMIAAAGEKTYLWPKEKMPDRQAGQIAAPLDVASADGFDRSKWTEPYLEWHEKPAKPNGTCIILLSGGGYGSWCDVGLIEDWKKEYTAAGCQTVSLVYRTPRPKGLAFYQSAWEDGQRGIRLVRSEAKKRGYDPEKIGAVSMSAGAHLGVLLGASALTPAYAPVDEIDKLPCHLAFSLPFAPAYLQTDAPGGTHNTRDGDAIDVTLDPIFKFDEKTCPMCLSHGGIDFVSPNGSTAVYRELRRRNIRAEVHLYADKWHGCFGIPRTTEFLRQLGFLGPVPTEEDVMQRFENVSRDVPRSGQLPIWGKERAMPDPDSRQCEPYLQWFVPEKLTTKAIQIIWSGGGYEGNSPDGFEVEPMRRYLNSKGMAVVTLRYRTPRPKAPLAKHTSAWQDAQRAIRLVRHGAKARGLDPERIGVMGSSAGGHLALMCATSSLRHSYLTEEGDESDKESCSAQWAIAIYPAYALEDGVDCENVRWGNDDADRLVSDFSFDLKTCPTLFIHGDSDGYSAMGSVKCWEQMRRMGVQSEVHTLAKRWHCFQAKASPGTGSYTWLDRAWEFLTEKGFNR